MHLLHAHENLHYFDFIWLCITSRGVVKIFTRSGQNFLLIQLAGCGLLWINQFRLIRGSQNFLFGWATIWLYIDLTRFSKFKSRQRSIHDSMWLCRYKLSNINWSNFINCFRLLMAIKMKFNFCNFLYLCTWNNKNHI